MEHMNTNTMNDTRTSKKRGCLGCLGCGMVFFMLSLLALFCCGLFHPSAFYYRIATLYPLVPDEDINSLFIGTWQLEIPYDAPFDSNKSGWKKTRLEILPNGTFVLTDPPQGLDWLGIFQGTLKGEWGIDSGWTNVFGEPIQKKTIGYWPDERGVANKEPTLRAMELWSIRPNNTDKKYHRLIPYASSADDYVRPVCPTWKRVMDE